MAKSQYYFDQRYLNTDDPWGIFCRPSQVYRLKGYIETIRRFVPGTVDSILEIGCADGYFTEMITKKGNHITAIDYEPLLIELAKKRKLGSHISFHESHLPALKELQGNFDLITAFEVILYFSDEEKRRIFSKIERHLSKGGYFIFTEEFDTVKRLFDGKAFEVKYVEKPYVNFLHLQDHFYNIARRLDFIIKFILKYKRAPRFTEFGEKYKHKTRISLLISMRPILCLLLPLIYIAWLLMYFVHSSNRLHRILILTSKLFAYKAQRQIIVLQKK